MTKSEPAVLPSGLDEGFVESIVESIGYPVFVKDRSFCFVLVNPAFCRLVGYERNQVLGRTDFDLFPEPEASFFRRKDEEMFARKHPVQIEEEPITDTDETVHVLSTTKVPLRDEEGRITHLVGIIHDITRLKEVEEALRRANDELERRVAERTEALRRAQDELLKRERLAALGQLAGGVAHQIRNPLGSIANATAILRRALRQTESETAHSAVAIIAEEVGRADRIIGELLEFGRVRPPERERVSLAPLVTMLLDAQPPPKSVDVVVTVDERADAWIDEVQVREALKNMLTNAFEAMPDGGRVSIECELQDDVAVLSLRDTGKGVEAAQLERLFEPLVTTKPYGLGLGLTVARALIENQGGVIRCISPEQGGARFDLILPRRDDVEVPQVSLSL